MEAGFMKALANTYQKKKPSGKYSAATTIRSRTGLPDSFSPADISRVWVCGFTSCCSALRSAVALFQPQSGIVEHLHPLRQSEPLARRPLIVDGAQQALGMRHENGDAPVAGGQARDALRRAAGVVGIVFGDPAAAVDIAQRHVLRRLTIGKNGPALAVCSHHGQVRAGHAGKKQRRAVFDPHLAEAGLEAARPVLRQLRPALAARDDFAQRRQHLGAVADAQGKAVGALEKCAEAIAQWLAKEN